MGIVQRGPSRQMRNIIIPHVLFGDHQLVKPRERDLHIPGEAGGGYLSLSVMSVCHVSSVTSVLVIHVLQIRTNIIPHPLLASPSSPPPQEISSSCLSRWRQSTMSVRFPICRRLAAIGWYSGRSEGRRVDASSLGGVVLGRGGRVRWACCFCLLSFITLFCLLISHTHIFLSKGERKPRGTRGQGQGQGGVRLLLLLV